jgi:hypothetical protein
MLIDEENVDEGILWDQWQRWMNNVEVAYGSFEMLVGWERRIGLHELELFWNLELELFWDIKLDLQN